MAAVASRYARALVDVVMDRKLDTAAVLQQMRDMVATIEGSSELRMPTRSRASRLKSSG